MIHKLKQNVLNGGSINHTQAEWLAHYPNKKELFDAAHTITKHFCGDNYDTCSIINAKSGLCSENCKWCAQSAHHKTAAEIYPLVDIDTCVQQAQTNRREGIGRFSLVTSGRKLSATDLKAVCSIYQKLKSKSDIALCASLGLLSYSDFVALKKAGVTRYHCNLETSRSYFSQLCTTHTIEDKIETLELAQHAGLEVCSGGIIGMGETMTDRIELAMLLQELKISSIPINILCPIKGTPLENMQSLSYDDILTTIALFRFINPSAYLRFSGGRHLLPTEVQEKARYIGINASIEGKMLTT